METFNVYDVSKLIKTTRYTKITTLFSPLIKTTAAPTRRSRIPRWIYIFLSFLLSVRCYTSTSAAQHCSHIKVRTDHTLIYNILPRHSCLTLIPSSDQHPPEKNLPRVSFPFYPALGSSKYSSRVVVYVNYYFVLVGVLAFLMNGFKRLMP